MPNPNTMAGNDERWHFVPDPQAQAEGHSLRACGNHVQFEREVHPQGTARRRCTSEPPPTAPRYPMLEVDVLSDLEAFFEEFDLAREPQDLALPRLQASDIVRLQRVRHHAGKPSPPTATGSVESPTDGIVTIDAVEDSTVECVVCLSALKEGDWLLEMPCSVRHRLHEQCARCWLARSASCPHCRADVRKLLPGQGLEASAEIAPSTRSGRRARRRRRQREEIAQDRMEIEAAQGARTRDGGIISRFEPHPPASWQRPVYIPEQLWHVAQFFEVNYPGRGYARVWRVPDSQNAIASMGVRQVTG